MLGSNTLQLMPAPMWLADESMHGTEIKIFTAILRYKITETEFKEAAKDACEMKNQSFVTLDWLTKETRDQPL